MMTHNVETFFTSGCGRCTLFDTPQCKVHQWYQELRLLRKIILEATNLTEEMKWGMPCYTLNKKNIVMLAAFKGYSCLSFFKGVLLNDPENLMVRPGKNSQAIKQFRFKSIEEIQSCQDILKAFIHEAITLEKQGTQITFKKPEEYPIPEEFQARMAKELALKEAFYKLTPGRRRAYLIYFSQAKQSKTRNTRIDKFRDKILLGKGLNE